LRECVPFCQSFPLWSSEGELWKPHPVSRHCWRSAFSSSSRTGGAAITFPVTFNDPGNPNAAYYAQITSHVQAAGANWAGYLAGSGSIEVQVEFTTGISGIDGAPFVTGFVRNNGTRDIYEAGPTYELRTGTDPNGASPDVRIRINPNYLVNTLWFDPNPGLRTDPIPVNHLDGVSLFIHELGHAFVFTGFMDGTTGVLPATYMSTFDEQVQFDGTNFYFIGANAQAKYGSPVPITFGNPFHLGNNSPRPGSDLLGDLMNGVVYLYQTRYEISALDLAITKDIGVGLLPDSRLLNISTRLRVQTGENALIGGFIITGTDSKRVIIRGIGPSLAQFFSGALANPTIELFQGSTLLASNDDWKESQQAEIEATGIPPSNDFESAIVRTLPPGSYTAIMRGKGDTTGIGVVEAYDLNPTANSKLANISTRGFVETGDNVMIGGLIVLTAARARKSLCGRSGRA
jgi:hypothetical protein